MAIVNEALLRRTFSKFTIGDDCWEWTASRNDAGYGQISAGGLRRSPLRAHRVIYEWIVGPIPEGLELDHLCRNRGCVNPSHLEPVTRGENARRGIGGQMTKERQAAKTHCKRGHEFTPENTRIQILTTGTPARVCRACHALRARMARPQN